MVNESRFSRFEPVKLKDCLGLAMSKVADGADFCQWTYHREDRGQLPFFDVFFKPGMLKFITIIEIIIFF